MTLTYSNPTQTLHHARHCRQCNRAIPRHRRSNECLRCEGRMGGYPIGATCPLGCEPPRHEWPAPAVALAMAARRARLEVR